MRFLKKKPAAGGPKLRSARARGHRKPPPPRWRRPLLVGCTLLFGCALAATTGWWIVSQNVAGRVLAALVGETVDWTRHAGLQVREVLAIGRQRTKSGDIRDKIENIYGQNILTVDISRVKARLEELPWVRSATVSRMLPDSLYLRLEERRPIALWQDGTGAARLIDEHGEVISVEELDIYRDLPVVSGNGARVEAASLFRQLLDQPELVGRISGAELVEGRRWNLFLDGRIAVQLPAERLEKAWQLLARTERETGILDRAIEAIDLRNPDWLIVRLVDEATGGASGQRA
ncbi:MAG: cell division protein FtsQ/DivIB [Geminicoccaceae bacterium]